MLEGDLGTLDLASLGLAAQVTDEFGALRGAGRAEGWTLDRRPPDGLEERIADQSPEVEIGRLGCRWAAGPLVSSSRRARTRDRPSAVGPA